MSDHRVIIVTGAAMGIGAAIVDQLLLSLTTHILLVDITEEPLKARQSTLGADRIQYVVGDVGKASTNKSAVQKAIETWGRLDALALNAGMMAPVSRICDSKVEEWQNILNVNLVSQVAMLSEAIPHLRRSEGRVIVTSSDAGEKPRWKSWAPYGCTKAALNYLIKALELEEPDLTVMGVYPGVVNTPLVQRIFSGEYSAGMSEEELDEYKKSVTPRLVTPDQPGSVIGELALRASADLRGEILFWNSEQLASYR